MSWRKNNGRDERRGFANDNGRMTEHLSKEGKFYTKLYIMMSWRRIEVRTVSCRIFQVNDHASRIES